MASIQYKSYLLMLISFIFYLKVQGLPIENNAANARIINGFIANKGQFPWHAILENDLLEAFVCSGSIIDKEWILTAAHCVNFTTHVKVGTNKLTEPVQGEKDYSVSIKVSEIYVHPDYDSSFIQNDIALIRLPQPLEFNEYIQPIPLVTNHFVNESFTGQMGITSGFGLMNDIVLVNSKILQWINIDIIENSRCMASFGSSIVTESVVCALDAYGNQAICHGDSGGALLVKHPQTQTLMQIGINSFVAKRACTRGYPSGHVRLTHYLPFIASITGMSF